MSDGMLHAHAQVLRWSAELTSEEAGLKLHVLGEWWFDAQALLHLRLTATRSVSISEAELHVQVRESVGRYMMGLGKGGNLLHENAPHDWFWQEGLGNYMVWLGDVDAGMRLRLVGESAAFGPVHADR